MRSDTLLAFLSRVELLLSLQSTAVAVKFVASEEDAGEDESEERDGEEFRCGHVRSGHIVGYFALVYRDTRKSIEVEESRKVKVVRTCVHGQECGR